MNKRKIQIILAISLCVLMLSFAVRPLTMSLYKWNEPAFTLGNETVTRQDLFDTLAIFSLSATASAFIMLIWVTLRKRR